jgi:hypothetical protein
MKSTEGLRDELSSLPGALAEAPEAGNLPARPIKPESAAAYIADLTTELAALARGCRLEILAYLLDIAQLEAENAARRLSRGSCV